MRLTLAAALACSFALTACSGSTVETGSDAGSGCMTSRNCPQTPPQICVDATSTVPGRCVPTCNNSNDCQNNQVCEDAICVNPGCGTNGDCSGAQVCSGGKCVAPAGASSIATCSITPDPAVVKVAGKVALTALVRDTDGKIVQATPIWSGDASASVDASGVVTGTAAGVSTITATVGTAKTCTASVKVYAGISAGIHAIVIDAHTKRPIAGAKVLLDHDATVAANVGTTDADGSVSFPAATGTHDVHAFAAEHNYASYIGVTAGTDLLIPMPPYIELARRSGFKSTLTADDFALLNKKGEILHVAFEGSGIPNSILDFSLDTLLGPMRQVTINIGGANKVDLPSGLVVGLADDLFGTGDIKIYAEPGERALWALGGNLPFDQLFAAVGPLLSGGGTPDVGSLLPQLLPLLSNLSSGSVVGIEAPPNVAVGGTPTFTDLKVPIDTPLRLRAVASVPDLPTMDGEYVDGVIALAGASAYPMGFTPLGMSAGIVAKDGNGKKTKLINDPSCDPKGTIPCNTSKIPFRLAARNNGLEQFKYGTVLIALNFSGLSTGSTANLAVSGIVRLDSDINFTKDTDPAFPITYAGKPFPQLGNSGAVGYSKASRTITVQVDAEPTTQIYRFEIENAARLTWNVWMAPVGAGQPAKNVILPDPSLLGGGIVDPAADIAPQGGTTPAGASGRMVGIITTDATASYSTLTGFGAITLDAIGNSLGAFTVSTVALSP